MTALRRFIRDLGQRLAGTYYEGPTPPPRLEQEVRLFAATCRDATVDDWKQFSIRLAEAAYCDGFNRGLEWAERLWPGPADDPEVLAEAAQHNWSLPEERLRQAEQQPSPIAGMHPREVVRLQHQLARAGARIVPLKPDPPRR